MVDIYGITSGVKGFKWVDEQERKQGFSLLKDWIIYTDEISLPTLSINAEEFYSEIGESEFYADFMQKIQRSMNPKMKL